MRLIIEGVVSEIDSLPGCSQVGVSHSVFVPLEKRQQGLGTSAGLGRVNHCIEHLQYDTLLCTCDMANTPQVKILKAVGWTLLKTFISSKTQHEVGIWSI